MLFNPSHPSLVAYLVDTYGNLKDRPDVPLPYGHTNIILFFIVANLWMCGLINSRRCGHYGASEQSSMHVLRDCKNMMAIWNILLPPRVSRSFFAVAYMIKWISRYLVPNSGYPRFPLVWAYVSKQTIHLLWINHTIATHGANHFLEGPYAITERCLKSVLDLLSVWNRESI